MDKLYVNHFQAVKDLKRNDNLEESSIWCKDPL